MRSRVRSRSTPRGSTSTAAASAPGRQGRIYQSAFGTDPAVWRRASALEHVAPDKDIPPILLVARGTPKRRAAVQAFADALREADVPVTVVEAGGYSHQQVNRNIGVDGEQVITPALTSVPARLLRLTPGVRRSAAFSAIMIVAALGWPLTMVGITDSVRDPQALDPTNPELGIDDGVVVDTHATGSRAVVGGHRVGAHERRQLLVARRAVGRQLVDGEVRQRRVLEDAAGQSDALDEHPRSSPSGSDR